MNSKPDQSSISLIDQFIATNVICIAIIMVVDLLFIEKIYLQDYMVVSLSAFTALMITVYRIIIRSKS